MILDHAKQTCEQTSGKVWPRVHDWMKIGHFSVMFLFTCLPYSAPAEGQQQQLKTTSDVTSKFLWCCRALVLWSGKEALDVAADDPPDEALNCRHRAWDVPYLCVGFWDCERNLQKFDVLFDFENEENAVIMFPCPQKCCVFFHKFLAMFLQKLQQNLRFALCDLNTHFFCDLLGC